MHCSQLGAVYDHRHKDELTHTIIQKKKNCISKVSAYYFWYINPKSILRRSVISSSRSILIPTNPHSYWSTFHCVLFVVWISFHIRWHSNNIQLGMCGAAMCVGTYNVVLMWKRYVWRSTPPPPPPTIPTTKFIMKLRLRHTKLRIDSNADERVSVWVNETRVSKMK